MELATATIVFEGDVLDLALEQRSGVPAVQQVQFKVLRAFKGVKIGRWSGAFSFGGNGLPATSTHDRLRDRTRRGVEHRVQSDKDVRGARGYGAGCRSGTAQELRFSHQVSGIRRLRR